MTKLQEHIQHLNIFFISVYSLQSDRLHGDLSFKGVMCLDPMRLVTVSCPLLVGCLLYPKCQVMNSASAPKNDE